MVSAAEPVKESVGKGRFSRRVPVVSGMLPFTLSIPGVTGALAAPLSSLEVPSLPQARSRVEAQKQKNIFFIKESFVIAVNYTIILPEKIKICLAKKPA
jgi:hypothetical protein